MAREVQWMICSYFPRLTWEQRRSAAWLALDPGRDCTLSFKRERNPEKILSHHLEAKLQIQSIETLGSSVIRHEKTKSYPRSTWLDAENHETTARMVKMCVKFWQPFIALWLDVVCLLAKCTYSIFIILKYYTSFDYIIEDYLVVSGEATLSLSIYIFSSSVLYSLVMATIYY